jgi:hypothetical protein
VRLCAKLPEGFPEEWRDLQLSVGVGLIFTEWNGINRAFFKLYAVSSVEEAVATMTRDDSSFLTYQFFIDGAYPAFGWDADWPLWRRRDSSLMKRAKAQGPEPWTWHTDRTLFDIRREPLGPYTGRLYLRFGGPSQAAATQTWGQCATVLRGLYRKWFASYSKNSGLPRSTICDRLIEPMCRFAISQITSEAKLSLGTVARNFAGWSVGLRPKCTEPDNE